MAKSLYVVNGFNSDCFEVCQSCQTVHVILLVCSLFLNFGTLMSQSNRIGFNVKNITQQLV